MDEAPRLNQYERVDHRGRFIEILASGTWETVIFGQMKPGAVLGNHYHKLTRLFFYLTAGRVDVDVVRVSDHTRRRVSLRGGEGAFLETGEAHAVRFRESSEFILVKSRRHDPSDTYAYEVKEER